ncbi:hypothetical protein TrVE_jg10773 [Triparma verrucosa]|uniref:Uncharacterized protein n=1 Tax=Triparma verrucosa TaxID=1606542 RepID=A0A9W7BV41_9STRA|nr:hypothetical protein TrVE_jg10773 [Triparma verrucosa]
METNNISPSQSSPTPPPSPPPAPNLQHFKRKFLAQAPLTPTFNAISLFNPPPTCFHRPCQSGIATIISAALNSPTPPSFRYSLKVLQLYSKNAEAAGFFVEDDEFMVILKTAIDVCKKITEPESDLLCYECFESTDPTLLPTKSPLAIRIAPFHNDVGLRCWEAGYFLAEFFLCHPEIIRNKRVLELGAGVGLTGLVCAGSPTLRCPSVHMTDYTPETIANMKHNVLINSEWLGEVNNKDSCTVGFLDWTELAEEKSVEGVSYLNRAEVLIAADCVYDRDYIPHLVAAVKLLLEGGGGNKQAIFATTFRNEATFELFISSLQSYSVKYEELKIPDAGLGEKYEIFDRFYIQQRSEVRIHKFTL